MEKKLNLRLDISLYKRSGKWILVITDSASGVTKTMKVGNVDLLNVIDREVERVFK